MGVEPVTFGGDVEKYRVADAQPARSFRRKLLRSWPSLTNAPTSPALWDNMRAASASALNSISRLVAASSAAAASQPNAPVTQHAQANGAEQERTEAALPSAGAGADHGACQEHFFRKNH